MATSLMPPNLAPQAARMFLEEAAVLREAELWLHDPRSRIMIRYSTGGSTYYCYLIGGSDGSNIGLGIWESAAEARRFFLASFSHGQPRNVLLLHFETSAACNESSCLASLAKHVGARIATAAIAFGETVILLTPPPRPF